MWSIGLFLLDIRYKKCMLLLLLQMIRTWKRKIQEWKYSQDQMLVERVSILNRLKLVNENILVRLCTNIRTRYMSYSEIYFKCIQNMGVRLKVYYIFLSRLVWSSFWRILEVTFLLSQQLLEPLTVCLPGFIHERPSQLVFRHSWLI